MTARSFRWHARFSRDVISYLVGIGIIVEQTFVSTAGGERPYLLTVAVTLVGIPTFLNLTIKRPNDEL